MPVDRCCGLQAHGLARRCQQLRSRLLSSPSESWPLTLRELTGKEHLGAGEIRLVNPLSRRNKVGGHDHAQPGESTQHALVSLAVAGLVKLPVGTRSKPSQGQLARRFEAGVQERDHGVYQCFAPPHALLAGHAYAKRHCGQDSCQGRSNCREEFGGHVAIVEYDRGLGGSGAAVATRGFGQARWIVSTAEPAQWRDPAGRPSNDRVPRNPTR